jgi:hypothetical protein
LAPLEVQADPYGVPTAESAPPTAPPPSNGFGSSSSGLYAKNEDGSDPEGSDQRGTPVTGGDTASEDVVNQIVAATGMSEDEVRAFIESTGAASVNINEDTGQIEGYNVVTYFDDVDAARKAASDAGDPYGRTIEQAADGRYYIVEEREYTQIDRNRADAAESARGRRNTGAPVDPNAGVNAAVDAALAQPAPTIGTAEVDRLIESMRKSNAYQQGRSTLAAMEASARAGLSADVSTGMGNEITAQYGLQGQEQESALRLDIAKQNLQAQIAKYQNDHKALMLKAAFAQSAVDRQAAIEQAKALAKIQARSQADLMRLEAELSAPSAGDIAGGLASSIFGGLTLGFGNALFGNLFE